MMCVIASAWASPHNAPGSQHFAGELWQIGVGDLEAVIADFRVRLPRLIVCVGEEEPLAGS